MRACFHPAVSGLMSSLIVLGLAGGPSAALSQETSAAPADTSAAPADIQEPPDASASSPAGTAARPDAAKSTAQVGARATSDANVNPARRNRASAARTAAAASDAA